LQPGPWTAKTFQVKDIETGAWKKKTQGAKEKFVFMHGLDCIDLMRQR
jgi:hypothetical protein